VDGTSVILIIRWVGGGHKLHARWRQRFKRGPAAVNTRRPPHRICCTMSRSDFIRLLRYTTLISFCVREQPRRRQRHVTENRITSKLIRITCATRAIHVNVVCRVSRLDDLPVTHFAFVSGTHRQSLRFIWKRTVWMFDCDHKAILRFHSYADNRLSHDKTNECDIINRAESI